MPVPGLLLGPLYRLRTLVLGTDFRYDLNHWRFHFSGVLDGRRALEELGYEPLHRVAWPGEGEPPPLQRRPESAAEPAMPLGARGSSRP